jgi:hypothetical protein
MALSLVPVMVAQYSRPFVGLGSSPAGTWLGSLLISLGLPALVALGVVLGGRRLIGEPRLLLGRAGVAVASMAFFSFVISVALERSASRFPVPGAEVTVKKKQFPTAVTLLALLAVLSLVKWQYGRSFQQGIQDLARHEPVVLEEVGARLPGGHG